MVDKIQRGINKTFSRIHRYVCGTKTIGYKFESSKKKDIFIYNQYMTSSTQLLVKEIFDFPMPVDVEKAYADIHKP